MASEKGVQPEVRRETKLSKETAETHPQKGKSVEDRNADVTLRLLEEHGDKFGPLTPEAEKKLRRKLYLRVMLLLSAVNIMLFVDKSTLGYAAILGLFEETGIRQTEYNNLNTMFYVGYLAFQWPGHYLMQRLPFGKYVATTVFCWSVIIFLHCVATRYAGLIVMRLALGAAEAVIVPAMEITIGMFFNRHEQSFLQPVLWITCQAAPMVTGFISYGLLWATGPVLPWKLLHIVTGGLTLLLAVWSSIEQKRFKREQFVETLRDPVSWLFALQSFTLMFSNNLNYGQKNLITTSIGVSPLGSTLVAAAGGGFGVACCVVATFALRRWPRNLALHGTVWCMPAVAGGVAMVTVDWEQKIGLLGCLILAASTYGVTYIIALGWTTSTAAGYTKKLTRNVMFMLGYSVGNLVSPQIWVAGHGPRFYGAWASMISVSWVGTPIILWIIRFILARRNAERLEYVAGLSDDEREGFVETVGEDGEVVRTKVGLAVLDLTDLQNKQFIYPL
ncbi:putative transporter PB1C11.03 like protein [Verticillium longisporum]|uniref:Putative transporter PB1C11.03 like protein n=1 Tax=Verticillium longisporum TaxID=100787 RepID=A0A8I2Z3L2_VERLO|nr:putative transporter PB1C11.03 like protein [Verticillium longisporum]